MSIFNIFGKKKNAAEDAVSEEAESSVICDDIKVENGEEPCPVVYSEQEMSEVEECVTRSFGEFSNVFHELFSPDIHVDIILVPPTEEANYYKLVTMGMGAKAMNVPPELREKYDLDYAEMVVFLPPDWDINSPDEKDYWPLRYLKILARLPGDYDTWLCVGHTVASGAEREPFAENTKLNNIVLLPALDLDGEEIDLTLSSGKKINFYQLYPIYQEELDYKLANSYDDLIDLFDDEEDWPIVKIDRKNYALED